MFQELEEIRPFELLKSQADRVNYLMTKQVGGCARRLPLLTCCSLFAHMPTVQAWVMPS